MRVFLLLMPVLRSLFFATIDHVPVIQASLSSSLSSTIIRFVCPSGGTVFKPHRLGRQHDRVLPLATTTTTTKQSQSSSSSSSSSLVNHTTMIAESSSSAVFSRTRTASESTKKRIIMGIYVHIPFCRRRCRYCNFAIVPIGTTGTTTTASSSSSIIRIRNLMDDYLDCLVREIQQTTVLTPMPDSPSSMIRSVYLGGGTPSLAPLDVLQTIIDTLKIQFAAAHSQHVIDVDAEWTMEMDPGTFDLPKLQAMRDEQGWTRISLGVQSLNDTLLHALGRSHSVHEIYEAVAMLQQVFGVHHNHIHHHDPDCDDPKRRRRRRRVLLSFSIDLIASVPGLSMAEWCHTLHRVCEDFNPPHISIYDLQIEPGTVLDTWYNNNHNNMQPKSSSSSSLNVHRLLPLPNDEDSAAMYRYASGYLHVRGYEQYEVSSYAKYEYDMSHHEESERPASPLSSSPYRSQHNQVYWHMQGAWYAFGLGATSLDEHGTMVSRPRTLYDYQQWVLQKQSLGHDDDDDGKENENETLQPLTFMDQVQNMVLTRLRTREGLDLIKVQALYGTPVVDAILAGAQLAIHLGLAVVVHDDEHHYHGLRLVIPDGFLFSNSILSSIFLSLEEAIL